MKKTLFLLSLLALTQSLRPSADIPLLSEAERLDVTIAAAVNQQHGLFFDLYKNLTTDPERIAALNSFFAHVKPTVTKGCKQSLTMRIHALYKKDDHKQTLMKQLTVPAAWKKVLVEEHEDIAKMFEIAPEKDTKAGAQDDNTYLDRVLKVAAQVHESWPRVSRADIETFNANIDLPIKKRGCARDPESVESLRTWVQTAQALARKFDPHSYVQKVAWCLLAKQGARMLTLTQASDSEAHAVFNFIALIPRPWEKEIAAFMRPASALDNTFTYFVYDRAHESYCENRRNTMYQLYPILGGVEIGTSKAEPLELSLARLISSYAVDYGVAIEKWQKQEGVIFGHDLDCYIKNDPDDDYEVFKVLDLSCQLIRYIGQLSPRKDKVRADTINLSHNLLSDEALCEMGTSHSPIGKIIGRKDLYLNSNEICAIAQPLTFLARQLDLGHNRIQSICSQALVACANLAVLKLDENEITHIEGGTLPINLQTLHLQGNPLNSVPEDIYGMDKLVCLDVSRCALPEAEIAALRKWWAQNPERKMSQLRCDDQQSTYELDGKHTAANANANAAAK